MSEIPECFHCGLPIALTFPNIYLELDGECRYFCCQGCKAVSQVIYAGGFEKFYQYRDHASGGQPSNKPPPGRTVDFKAFDLPEVQSQFVTETSESLVSQARLFLPDITCAACSWLIEHHLNKVLELESVTVNVSDRCCQVRWNTTKFPVSKIFESLEKIGYQAQPAIEEEMELLRRRENKTHILRLGVAGIGMMQVGMAAIALHAGDFQGIDSDQQHYLRWLTMIVAIPVIFYSAQPFFKNALRALKARSVNMDVSVSLGIGLAFLSSVWSSLTHSGEVYFDSITMLVFFLLLGRYLEFNLRNKSAKKTRGFDQLLPLSAKKIHDGVCEAVPLKQLVPGDSIVVDAGEVFPVDAQVIDGVSHADESMLTGESVPVQKSVGSSVSAGTINGPSALSLRVINAGNDTALSCIRQLREQALLSRPKYQSIIDRMASVFVLIVIFSALSAGLFWLYVEPDQAFWVALSVLIVTCPCALSLATPAALTAALQRLQGVGLMITSGQFLERTRKVTHIVFDKTGTLTLGELKVAEIRVLDGSSQAHILSLIAALEKSSAHPIAKAFDVVQSQHKAESVKVVEGAGVTGQVNGVELRFGLADFAVPEATPNYPGVGLWQLLSSNLSPLAWVRVEDSVRADAAQFINFLKRLGLKVCILSGDRQDNVKELAEQLSISAWVSAATPDAKQTYIDKLQQQGAVVMMVGDGINDVPVLSRADVSIAMGHASQLTKISSDSVLLGEKLGIIGEAIALAKKTDIKIKQNLLWAIAYNALALPFAVMGLVPPVLAAVGMSLSSLVVVLNSLSLGFTSSDSSK